MDRELIDRAWRVLPAEFREEVKKMWQYTDKEQQLPHDAFLRGEYSILVSLFGIHNLTSDAEVKEILTCEKSKVEEEYKKACEAVNRHSTTTGSLFFVGQKQTIEAFFPEIVNTEEYVNNKSLNFDLALKGK